MSDMMDSRDDDRLVARNFAIFGLSVGCSDRPRFGSTDNRDTEYGRSRTKPHSLSHVPIYRGLAHFHPPI